jgi:hypothetical protein
MSWNVHEMPSEIDELTKTIELFKADLAALDVREVVRKHITTGTPVVLNADDYYELRRDVASHFGLHPNAVVLVGSCRMGFALKHERRWQSALPGSDLDLALVSADRFDDYWDRVFQYARSDLAWTRTRRFSWFLRVLFRGWIDPRSLPTGPRFSEAKAWADFFDGLMRSRRFGPRRISARLYRSWDRLEAYQEIMVRSCAKEHGA